MAVGEAALAGLGDAAHAPPRSPPCRRPSASPCWSCAARRARRGWRGSPLVEEGQRPLDQLVVGAAGLQLLERLRGDRRRRAAAPPGHVRLGRLGKPRLGLAAAAQLGVHAEHDAAQPADVECGDGALALAIAFREESLERLVEGLAGRPLGLGGVEHPEARIDADRDRVGRRAGGCRSRGSSSPRRRRARAAARGRAPIPPRRAARSRPGFAGAARRRPCR